MPPPGPLPPSVLSPLHARLYRLQRFFVESYESRPRQRLHRGLYQATSQQRSPLQSTHSSVKDKRTEEEKFVRKLEEITKGGGRGKPTADLFYEGYSPWRDASFLHTIYTTLHSGTRLCRYFADTSPRGGPV